MDLQKRCLNLINCTVLKSNLKWKKKKNVKNRELKIVLQKYGTILTILNPLKNIENKPMLLYENSIETWILNLRDVGFPIFEGLKHL